MKEDMDTVQMKECTFAPQIVRPNDRPRSLEEFLQDQSKFQQKRNDTIAKISSDNKDKVEGSVSLRPQIDGNSAAMAQQKPRNEPIFERLFEISKKPLNERIKKKLTKEEEEKAAKAEIEKKMDEERKAKARQEHRELKLYNIALQKKKEEEEKAAEEKHKKATNKPVALASNDPLVVLGFRKEFQAALMNSGSVDGKVKYEQMSNIDM